jgi:alkanesulfonate monooxygenase SsuD/methylene tetrahydromethanopterin reductase-like flavin-dependent oxidoreductase (luciferase family)
MRFTWFNFMPWPYLPADFSQTRRSVWVDIDPNLFDPVRGHALYNSHLDLLEYAATLGFDGVGVNEHHQTAYGMMPSPNLFAAALARRTQDAAIVVLGPSIVNYNPPVRVAEELALLDCLSGGRLVAGFPLGTPMDSNFSYGNVPALTRERYTEAHDLIVRALTEMKPFAFNGRYSKLRDVNIWPRPVQKPIPIHIPGAGSMETWDFAIEHDYSYSCLSFGGYRAARGQMQAYWDRLAEKRPDDLSPYRAGFAQVICVAETDEEAERLYSKHVRYFYNSLLHVHPGYLDVAGYRGPRTVSAMARMMYEAPVQFGNDQSWGDLVESGKIIAGSPATVRDRLVELIETLKVGNLFCQLHIGDMDVETCMYSTRLFAEKVIPQLRGIHGARDADDRFWCKPIDQTAPRDLRELNAQPQKLRA